MACSVKSCFDGKILVFYKKFMFTPKYVIDFSLEPKESYQLVENGHLMTPLKY